MLEPEAYEIEWCAQEFRDDRKHQHVEENRKEVILVRTKVRPIAESACPAGDEQHDQQCETDHRVGHAQPTLEPVVTAYLRRISPSRIGNCCHPIGIKRTRLQVAPSLSLWFLPVCQK